MTSKKVRYAVWQQQGNGCWARLSQTKVKSFAVQAVRNARTKSPGQKVELRKITEEIIDVED